MWYAIILILGIMSFYLSPYEPLLQACVREKVEFKAVIKKFPLYSKGRIFIVALGTSSSFFIHAISSNFWAFTPILFSFVLIYIRDFITANKIVLDIKD